MEKYGIIAGTGFDKFGEDFNEITIQTDYGIVKLKEIRNNDYVVYFIARHGENHNISPSNINYRANIAAMKKLNVSHIIGICAVGSLKYDININNLVLANDFLDMTKNRTNTFYNNDIVKHLDVSEPYNLKLNDLLKSSLEKYDFKVESGVYVCTEGPRFESKTEIKLYQMLQCDVVGMTNIPEVILAAEADITYSLISYVTNYCTGMVEKLDDYNFSSDGINKDYLIKSIFDVFDKNPVKLGIFSNNNLL